MTVSTFDTALGPETENNANIIHLLKLTGTAYLKTYRSTQNLKIIYNLKLILRITSFFKCHLTGFNY